MHFHFGSASDLAAVAPLLTRALDGDTGLVRAWLESERHASPSLPTVRAAFEGAPTSTLDAPPVRRHEPGPDLDAADKRETVDRLLALCESKGQRTAAAEAAAFQLWQRRPWERTRRAVAYVVIRVARGKTIGEPLPYVLGLLNKPDWQGTPEEGANWEAIDEMLSAEAEEGRVKPIRHGPHGHDEADHVTSQRDTSYEDRKRAEEQALRAQWSAEERARTKGAP